MTDSLSRRLKPHALIRVFVPSHDRHGRSLTSHASLRQLVEEGFLGIAGGATCLSGEGVYRNGHPAPVREPVVVVESYLPSRITVGHRRAFRRLIEEFVARADQEAVAIAVGGRLFLITSEEARNTGETMWYRDSRWRSRLIAEQALMRERFPQFRLFEDSSRGLSWEGLLEPAAGHVFRVSVACPPRYPYQPPVLRVIQPPLRRGAPHLYADGTLCVHRQRWDPMTGTAASCVPLVAAWLVGYLGWVELGEPF